MFLYNEHIGTKCSDRILEIINYFIIPQAKEEKQMYFREVKERCANCKYYLQHYIKVGYTYTVTDCGHCVYPRIKHRGMNQTCKYFTEGCYGE